MATLQDTSAATGSDLARVVTVTLAEIACVFGTLVGVGVIGTRVEESSGGALAADATLLAPLGPAFSIWSVIYLGLAAYTIVQWLPSRRSHARFRATGWLAALTMLLNAAWLLVTQQGWIWVSVVVIAALVLSLGVLVRRLAEAGPADSTVDRVVVDATFGLYLGWVAVATCANVTAAFVADGVDPGPPVADVVAAVVIAVAVGVVALVFARTGRRLSVALAAGWGLAWIAVARLSDQPHSALTGVAAGVAAAVVLVMGVAWPARELSRS